MTQRTIKFRCWDKSQNKWLLGYELPNLGGFSLFGEIVMLGEWSTILDEYIFERNGHKQDDLIVMQFTGLKDKSGKEIFEGDILKPSKELRDEYMKHYSPSALLQVEWLRKGAEFCFVVVGTDGSIPTYDVSAEGCEIIGNVWEHPELLEPDRERL